MPSVTPNHSHNARGNNKLYFELVRSIENNAAHNSPKRLEEDINPDSEYQTKEEQKRDRHVTNMLKEYVEAYTDKRKTNKLYRSRLFWLCFISTALLVLVCIVAIGYCLFFTQRETKDIIALVASCVSVIGAIAFLLEIIAKYIFPPNDEEIAAKVVQTIQANDLEEQKLRIQALKDGVKVSHTDVKDNTQATI